MTARLEQAHSNMVMQQVRPGDVLSQAVLKAMSDIDRSLFVDDELAALAYVDTELPIGYGQMMLSPIMEGRLLQTLDIQPDEHVLEIGTGSGYFTALLASLARNVTTVELIPELSAKAQQNLTALNIDNVIYEVGDASRGWPLDERIDVIVLTAAVVTIPDEFLQSIKVGGRMLAVVGKAPVMSVQMIHRTTEWDWQYDNVFETLIAPMINAEPKQQFEF